MSSVPPAPADPTLTTEKRFLALNRDRLARVHANLTPRQRDFLDLLPLLFHLNHPLLPGYVAKETVIGINDYAPNQRALRAARRVCRSFEYDRRSAPRYAVRGLYLMGSPGTIAYSRESDLDLWLLHDPGLSAEAVEELAEKARRIEIFAGEVGLEVHFFVFDAERFRHGETLSLSAESSGSSQHYLLLDEFYRSGLLIAGLPPLWWRVPASHDTAYEGYLQGVTERRAFDRRDYIDFGGLRSIPVEEFFGAAVWQLYKSIESPYKSVLKLLLMESYAAEYPNIGLLSHRFKQNVESSTVNLNAFDPYILMYTKVEEYLLTRNDPVRLDVLRRSFYLKTSLRLSSRESALGGDWRREALAAMVEDWHWTPAQVVRLDQRDDWRIDTAIEERRDLINTLKDSYAALSQFARQHATDQKITEHDLNVLGRKLYAAFEKKPAKIEVLTRGICINPAEASLSLHEIRTTDNATVWLLFAGLVKPTEVAFRRPMKRSAAAAEILLWCQLNRLSTPATTWHVFTAGSELNALEIKRIGEAFDSGIGQPDAPSVLDQRPRIMRLLLLVNIGVNAFSGAVGAGSVLTTDHTDAFRFGGRRINLLKSVDLIFANSWGETFAFRYEGDTSVLDALAECVQWAPFDGSARDLPPVEVRCFTSDYANQIARRVSTSFLQAGRFVARYATASNPHFVLEIDDRLQHLRVEDGKARVDSHASHALLLRALGDASSNRFNPVRFDRGCTRVGVLPRIYAQNRPGRVQIYAQQRGERADIYILDERGLLLVQRQECHDMKQLLHHYRRFLDNALPRCTGLARAFPGGLVIETHEVLLQEAGVQFKLHAGEPSFGRPYLSLQVLADADAQGRQQFTINANHREFSTWEHGGSLFQQVAEYVFAQRAGTESYPIYITDLDLSTRFRIAVGVRTLRPLDLLSYKKRIEYQLTRALSREGAVPIALAS